MFKVIGQMQILIVVIALFVLAVRDDLVKAQTEPIALPELETITKKNLDQLMPVASIELGQAEDFSQSILGTTSEGYILIVAYQESYLQKFFLKASSPLTNAHMPKYLLTKVQTEPYLPSYRLQIWDMTTDEIAFEIELPDRAVTALSSDETKLAISTGDFDGIVSFVDLATGEQLDSLDLMDGNLFPIADLKFHPSEAILAVQFATITNDAWLILLNYEKREVIKNHIVRPTSEIEFNHNGTVLAGVGDGGSNSYLILSDIGPFVLDSNRAIYSVDFSHDDSLVVSQTTNFSIDAPIVDEIVFWDGIDGTYVKSFEREEHEQVIGFSSDDKLLMTLQEENEKQIMTFWGVVVESR